MRAWYGFLVGGVCLPLAVHSAGGMTDAVSTWRLSGDIDGYGSNVVQVCLSKGDINREARWEALSVEVAGADCQELVVADRDRHLLHLAFPGAVASSGYYCSSKVKVSGRHPCNSAFYVSNSSDKDRKVLDRVALKAALQDGDAFSLLEQLIAANDEALRSNCQQQLDAANSSDEIKQVMGDCDVALGVEGKSQATAKILKIESKIAEAALAAYRNDFDMASRLGEGHRLEEFIERYKSNDPDHLVPQAISELARIRRMEANAAAQEKRQLAIEAERRASERAARDAEDRRRSMLTKLERQIGSCKAAMASAVQAKAREHAISADSGYTDAVTLRRAAAIEYDCNKAIKADFARYKDLGGTKDLSQIQ